MKILGSHTFALLKELEKKQKGEKRAGIIYCSFLEAVVTSLVKNMQFLVAKKLYVHTAFIQIEADLLLFQIQFSLGFYNSQF